MNETNIGRPAYPVQVDPEKPYHPGFTKIEAATLEIAGHIAAVALSAAYVAETESQMEKGITLAIENAPGVAYAIALRVLNICNTASPQANEYTFGEKRPETHTEIQVFQGGAWTDAAVLDDKIEVGSFQYSFRVLLEGGGGVPTRWRLAE